MKADVYSRPDNAKVFEAATQCTKL